MKLKNINHLQHENNHQSLPTWMTFLLLLIYLRMMQPPPPPPPTASLNRTIWAVTIILCTLIVAMLGRGEQIAEVLQAFLRFVK